MIFKTNQLKATIHLFLIIIITLFLVGCGPIYETMYHYIPPSDNIGMGCVNNCMMSKNLCHEKCRLEKAHHDMMNNLEKARHDMNEDLEYQRRYNDYLNKSRDSNRSGIIPFPPTRNTNNHYQSPQYNLSNCENPCNGTYNFCYQGCGGQIITSRECVAFCN